MQGHISFSVDLATGDQFVYQFVVSLQGTKSGLIDLGDGGQIIQNATVISDPGIHNLYYPINLDWGAANTPNASGLGGSFDIAINISKYFVHPAGSVDVTTSSVTTQSVSATPSISVTGGPLSSIFSVGDYNRDGIVDAADYTVWRDTLGSRTNLAADGDNNGTVTQADYDAWVINFGNHAGSGAGAKAAVPEPATIGLAACGLVMVVLPWVRRRTVR